MREFDFNITYKCGHNGTIRLSGDIKIISDGYAYARHEKCSDCKAQDKYIYGLVKEYKSRDYDCMEEVIMISKDMIKDGITIAEIADRFNMTLESYRRNVLSEYDCSGEICMVYAKVRNSKNYIVIYNHSRFDV